MKRVTWLILGLVIAAGILAACAPLWLPGPEPETRAIRAGVTTWPMYAMRDSYAAATSAPPLRPTQDALYSAGARYPLALDCNTAYLDTTWPTAGTGNIDWTAYDNCFAWAAQYTITLTSGTVISQPVVIDIPPNYQESGTHGGNYTDIFLPAWLSGYTATFTTTAGIYNTLDYSNATLRGYMTDFISAAAARYGTNPQLAGVRAYVGHEGESQPNKPQLGENATAFLQRAETIATCTQYTTWITTLTDATYNAFPNHPVWVMAATDPCSTQTGNAWRSATFPAWFAIGRHIGASLNSLRGDYENADEKIGNAYRDYRMLRIGSTMATAQAPMWFEYGQSADVGLDEYGGDQWRYGYWANLAGVGAKGDFVSRNYTWGNFYTVEDWRLADYWLGSDKRMWVVLRDLEYPNYNTSASYGASGYIGDFNKNGYLLTPTVYPQTCNEQLRGTAIARATTAYSGTTYNAPMPCAGTALPTPKATLQSTPSADAAGDANMMQRLFNRQARLIPANTNLRIAVDSTWAYYGTTQAAVTVTLTYLDIGTDALTVAIPPSTAWTFNRTNTGNWLRKSWVSPTSVPITNYLSCRQTTSGVAAGCFIYILNGASDAYIHEVYADVGGAPGATVTPGPTDPSMRTNTPTVTATPPSVTTTPIPTATRWPGYYLDSPMDAAPAENWNWYGTNGANRIATATAECVTAGCWQWTGYAGFNYAQVYWKYVPTPYAFEYVTTTGSLHIAFDIKMVETPVSGIGIFADVSGGNSPLNTGLGYMPRATGAPNPWSWSTENGGGIFRWNTTDGIWQHVDIYADQQAYGYVTNKTPQAGELPYRLSVNGTPIATPTGKAPSLEVIAANLPLNGWRFDYYNNIASGYKYMVDNFQIQHMQCDSGTCPSPTPVGTIAVWTVTPSPTATFTPSRTPTASLTPSTTPSPTPTRTPTMTMTPVRTIPCPTKGVTPDGNLVEWVGGFAAELNAGSAAYIAPPNWTITPVPTATGTPPTSTPTVTGTPPTATPAATATATPDAQLLLYCAHTTGFLAMAGIITDTAVLTPTSDLEFGDAAEVGIDGANDWMVQPYLDDRDILVSPGGRILNYGIPMSATVGISRTAGGWIFEALIPVSELGTGNLTAGKIIGLIFGYYDRATALERRYFFSSGWYGGVMQ
jgi:hypothetical protein